MSVRVTLRNVGHIIEGFRFEVKGEGVCDWAEVSPPRVECDVDQEKSAVVLISPPADMSARSGTFPFAVLAVSVVDASSSAAAEGDLEIGQVYGLTSKITPVTSTGRWRGSHRVQFTNWGNGPVKLHLQASDPDERLGFLVAPESLAVPLGGTVEARVRARTRAPFLRGTPVRLPFQVVAEPFGSVDTGTAPSAAPDPQRQVLDGAMLQKPIISRFIVVAAALVVMLGVAGVGLALSGFGETGEAPARPAAFVVDGTTEDSVILAWRRSSGLEAYRLLSIDPDDRETVTDTRPLDEALGQFTVRGLDSDVRYCFALAAVANGKPSRQTGTECAKTQKPPAKEIPSLTGVDVGNEQKDSLTLTWTPIDDLAADEYEPQEVRADGAVVDVLERVPAVQAQAEVTGLDPGTEHCYQVVVYAGADHSAPSEVVCGTTKATSTDGGNGTNGGDGSNPEEAPTSGAPVPEDWVLVFGTQDIEATAIENVATLRADGFEDAAYVASQDFPNLLDGDLDTFVVYVMKGTQAEVTRQCPSIAQRYPQAIPSCIQASIYEVGEPAP